MVLGCTCWTVKGTSGTYNQTRKGVQAIDPSNRQLRPHEMYLLCAMYWPYEEIGHAVAIAYRESGWNTGAHNTKGEDSRGLWQINVSYNAHPHLSNYNLFDPQVCAFFAYQLWKEQGWKPWSTYTGDWKDKLPTYLEP